MLCRLHTGASVAALEILRDSGMKRLPVELTGWWVGIQDERKWRRDAGEALVRARMLQAPDLDAHLAKVRSPSPSCQIGCLNGLLMALIISM